MSVPVDLRELSLERTPRRTASLSRARSRSWLTRYVIPLAMLLGFAAVLGWTLKDELLPATQVTVLPVVVSRAKVEQSNAPMFPAAGWVEPRPSPVIVTSLVEGVVERVTVVEGQDVTAGQPVAYLIRKDAEIATRQAEAELAQRVAEQATAEAQLVSARAYFNEPIQRQSEVADAEAQLAKVQTELSRMPSQMKAAEAKAAQASKEFDLRSKSRDTTAAILVDRAQSELHIAEAAVDESREQAKALLAERVALTRRRDVLKRLLELKVDETRQLAEAQAGVQVALAKRHHAQATLDAAKLRLERMTIVAPMKGKVLALVARPGSRLMGLERAAMLDASTVISMYDPSQLQIRADVRLEDLPRVIIGQPVRIETPAVSGSLMGRVIAMTSTADIQKNTLQVKVSVDAPHPLLRPDMLVQVTFMAPPQPRLSGAEEPALRLMVPRAIVDSTGEYPTAWIVDPASGFATQRRIVLGENVEGDLVEATSGLHVGDRLIVGGREGLRNGARIRIKGEDRSLGRAESAAPHHLPAKPIRSN